MMRFVLAPLFLAALVSCRSAAKSSVRCDDAYCYCTSQDGRVLGYQTPVDSDVDKTCQCAVDKDAYAQTGVIGLSFDCDEHGNYNPVRCIGSVCHCASTDGRHLGYETPIHQTPNMTCQCALDKDAYDKEGLIGQSFSCDAQGNYQPVRCVGSVCHCSTTDGRNLGYETPIHQVSDKTCQCAVDKDAFAQTGMVGQTFSCDQHGNYEAVRCVGSVCHCSTTDGRNLGYETPIHQVSDKTCQCALDKDAFAQTGMVGQTFSCDEHGNYNAVRCVGSVCHCSTTDGRNLGYETPIHQVSDKTCQCALDRDAYSQTGMVGQSFSCDEHGNYNAVRCVGSVCHCSSTDGRKLGYETPIHQVSQKTCQCALDKDAYTQTGMIGKTFSCDEHGNYNAVHCTGSVCTCASADGRNLGFPTPIHQVSEKTCQCALDKDAYSQDGMIGQSFSCDQHGNYKSVRCVGSVCFCVDANGKQLGTSTAPIGQHDELNC